MGSKQSLYCQNTHSSGRRRPPLRATPPPKLAVWSPLRKGTLSSLLSCFTIIYSAHRNLTGFRMLGSIVLSIFPSPWCQRMSQALEANILQGFLWEENPWGNFALCAVRTGFQKQRITVPPLRFSICKWLPSPSPTPVELSENSTLYCTGGWGWGITSSTLLYI